MLVILLADLVYEPPLSGSNTGGQWSIVLYNASFLVVLRSGWATFATLPPYPSGSPIN